MAAFIPRAGEYRTVRILAAPVAERTISFARGAPSADILPHEAVREAAARALESDWEKALTYGTGRGPSRALRVDRRAPRRRARAGDGHQRLDGGARRSCSATCVVRGRPGGRRAAHLRPHPAAAEAGRRRARSARRSRPTASIVDGGRGGLRPGPTARSPTSSPTSTTRPAARSRLEKRQRLVELAARARLHPLRGRPLPADQLRGDPRRDDARAWTSADRVIHASSFSKTVSPGVRVGYLVGPAEQIATLAKRANETLHLAEHARRVDRLRALPLRRRSRRTSKVVNAALARAPRRPGRARSREHIPEAEFVVPEGGYFLWLDLNDDVDTTALLAEAKEEGVTFVAGPDFMLEGGASSLRLSFAPVPAGDRRGHRAPRARPGADPRERVQREGGLDPLPEDLLGAPVEAEVLGAARIRLAALLDAVGLDRPGDRDQPALGEVAVRDQCPGARFHLPSPFVE